jgi:putative spermidine/putrescine transport system permease protein
MVMGAKFGHFLHRIVTSLLLILIAVPFIPLVLSSFSAGWRWPEVIPDVFTIRAWQYVFSVNAGTWAAFGNSLQIAFAVTLFNMVFAIPAADALARAKFKGKRIIEGMLFAPIIIPPFVAVMGMHMTFIRLGLTESVIGVILAHVAPTLPYMLRALIVSYSTLGFQWEEQARMLGAGRYQRFWYVVLPHLLPGMAAGASLSVLISLSQYLITFLVGGGQVMTLPIILFPFISGGDPAVGSTYTLIFAAMAALALWGMDILLKRYYGKRITVHV